MCGVVCKMIFVCFIESFFAIQIVEIVFVGFARAFFFFKLNAEGAGIFFFGMWVPPSSIPSLHTPLCIFMYHSLARSAYVQYRI